MVMRELNDETQFKRPNAERGRRTCVIESFHRCGQTRMNPGLTSTLFEFSLLFYTLELWKTIVGGKG